MVDFVCKRIKLVVEIDGVSHFSDAGTAHDARRTEYLADLGYRVLRFTNAEVMGNAEGVLEVLRGVLGDPVA